MHKSVRHISLSLVSGLIVCHFFLYGPVLGQTSVIKGTIKNGTTGEPATVSTLTLMGFETGMDIVSVLNDVDAAFTIPDVKPFDDRPYLIQAEYNGVQYNTNVMVPSGSETVAVEILVYEQTDEPGSISIQDAQYQFSISGTTLQILKTYVVINESENPRTYVNDNGTFQFQLPPESHGINYVTVNTGLVPLNQEPLETDEEGVYAIDYPLKPGVTQVSVSYHVEYSNKFHSFSEDLLYDISNLVIVTSPADMLVIGDNLTESGGDAHRDFSIFRRENLALGENLTFMLSGGTPDLTENIPPSGQPVPTPKMSKLSIIFLVIAITAVLGIGTAFSRNKAPIQEKRKKNITKKITNRKEEMLEEIAELDDKYSDHHISKSDYHRQRAILKNRLVELYKKIENTE